MSILGDWLQEKIGKDTLEIVPEVPDELPWMSWADRPPHPSSSRWSATSDFPITIACSTAMDDYPIQPMTELKYEPLAEWVCQWCGNMWLSDITSCEKCGGPKGEIIT